MIQLRNVERTYKTGPGVTYVLRRINVDIHPGEHRSRFRRQDEGAGHDGFFHALAATQHHFHRLALKRFVVLFGHEIRAYRFFHALSSGCTQNLCPAKRGNLRLPRVGFPAFGYYYEDATTALVRFVGLIAFGPRYPLVLSAFAHPSR